MKQNGKSLITNNMKKDLKEEEGVSEYYLQARIDLLQSVVDKQAEGLALYKQLVDSKDKRSDILSKMIDAKDEINAILERQKIILEKENLRLNIAIGVFLSLALALCIFNIWIG
jgi:hypothetical protein